MRWITRIGQIGTGWLAAGVGVAVGLAFAVPAATTAGGTVHAVMAGVQGSVGATADQPTSTTAWPGHSSTGGDGSTGGHTTIGGHVSTAGPTTTAGSTTTGDHTTAGDGSSTVPGTHPTPTSGPTTSSPTTSSEPTTTAAPGGTTPPSSGSSTPTAPTTANTAECVGAVTSLTVTRVHDGWGVVVTVMVSGQVGWMSAEAVGVGGAALRPIPGGWQGTITSSGPIPAGTRVVVGSCHNHVHATTVLDATGAVGGGGTGDGATGGGATGGGATGGGEPGTTAVATPPVSELANGCATAAITTLRAALAGGGQAVRVSVALSGQVGSMSAEVEGFGVVAMTPVPGGFRGALVLTGGATIPAGTTVIVGTCGGALRATTTVQAN